ncbi:MAG: transposase [Planctomycetes bacterium]|nr:transposase [Planctomycetota bacterium]
MSEYRRWYKEGGMYFFTLVTYERQELFVNEPARQKLRQAFDEVRMLMSFEVVGIVLLPNHLHCLWQLPAGDSDYSKRWGLIKKTFTQSMKLENERQVSVSRQKRREKGMWQRRFWEHTIRDRNDLANHMDYIHYNPVKHGLVRCPHQWDYSSFHRWVKEGAYQENWLCNCRGYKSESPDFKNIKNTVGE